MMKIYKIRKIAGESLIKLPNKYSGHFKIHEDTVNGLIILEPIGTNVFETDET